MARATLTYTLPDEAGDFHAALQGADARLVLWSFDQYLRNRTKYEELPSEARKALRAAREELHSLLTEHGISLDD